MRTEKQLSDKDTLPRGDEFVYDGLLDVPGHGLGIPLDTSSNVVLIPPWGTAMSFALQPCSEAEEFPSRSRRT